MSSRVATSCGILLGMDAGNELDTAARAHRRAEARLEETRQELAAAIVAARNAGMSPGEIERRSGYRREHVRRILREHGFGPAR